MTDRHHGIVLFTGSRCCLCAPLQGRYFVAGLVDFDIVLNTQIVQTFQILIPCVVIIDVRFADEECCHPLLIVGSQVCADAIVLILHIRQNDDRGQNLTRIRNVVFLTCFAHEPLQIDSIPQVIGYQTECAVIQIYAAGFVEHQVIVQVTIQHTSIACSGFSPANAECAASQIAPMYFGSKRPTTRIISAVVIAPRPWCICMPTFTPYFSHRGSHDSTSLMYAVSCAI
uniref:Uncharacterized protein n=1 Tax=uncultured bacterium fosmid pJB148G3 TaxID=1478052 RepID=A0A0H3UAW4_9BACT|nr:hypothetical protein [uncultured bacterium fosmid pJB148G3]